MTTTSPPSRRRALVLYGSETGNAQDVAEELGRIAERLRFDTDVAGLNAISLVCLSFYHFSLVAAIPALRHLLTLSRNM
jgi:sulfite reductase alpha subunit-like flavoprotein